MVCPLYRGCPLLRGSNRIILIGRDKFGDLVLSIVERYLIQCPFLGGSSLRGSTVDHFYEEYLHMHIFTRTAEWALIKIMTRLLTTIRKARNDCQDVEHCQEDNW